MLRLIDIKIKFYEIELVPLLFLLEPVYGIFSISLKLCGAVVGEIFSQNADRQRY
jgi:hypothetical protein